MDIAELLVEMQRGPLQSWAEQLPTQIAKGMNIKRYGDLPRWQAALTPRTARPLGLGELPG